MDLCNPSDLAKCQSSAVLAVVIMIPIPAVNTLNLLVLWFKPTSKCISRRKKNTTPNQLSNDTAKEHICTSNNQL